MEWMNLFMQRSFRFSWHVSISSTFTVSLALLYPSFMPFSCSIHPRLTLKWTDNKKCPENVSFSLPRFPYNMKQVSMYAIPEIVKNFICHQQSESRGKNVKKTGRQLKLISISLSIASSTCYFITLICSIRGKEIRWLLETWLRSDELSHCNLWGVDRDSTSNFVELLCRHIFWCKFTVNFDIKTQLRLNFEIFVHKSVPSKVVSHPSKHSQVMSYPFTTTSTTSLSFEISFIIFNLRKSFNFPTSFLCKNDIHNCRVKLIAFQEHA